MTLLRLLRRGAPFVGWAVLILGVLLQAWLKDRHPPLALLFYAMPKPCLALLAFILVVWPGVTRNARLIAGAAAVALTIWWYDASWQIPSRRSMPAAADSSANELKVLYWNLCRPSGFDEEMVAMVTRLQPDVAAFVEPGPNAGKLAPEYERRLPGYQVTSIPRGILWVSRLPSRLHRRGKLQGMGAFATLDVRPGEGSFRLVVADVFPHPFLSREPQLREALQQTEGRRDAILLGDFNTPAESVHYDLYRRQMTSAFDTAGHGFRETWPLGLPLLSLDHIWVGEGWEVLRAERLYMPTGSDHAALFVTLRRLTSD